jgi:hypothetical protein
VAGVSVKSEEIPDCSFDFVFDNKLDLITIITRGCTTEENITKAIKLGQTEAKNNFDAIRERVRERFTLQEVNKSPDVEFDDL